MVANTLAQRILISNPNIEVVTLDCTEAYTYTSQKFRVIDCALICANDAGVDAHINVETDGSGTVTTHYVGAAGEDVTLVLFGHSGGFTSSAGL